MIAWVSLVGLGYVVVCCAGSKRDTEERSERPTIKNVDADDSDVEAPSDSDERYVELSRASV